MWVFSKDGFISVVNQNDTHGQKKLCRARAAENLKPLAEQSGEKVFYDDQADYPYRLVVSKRQYKRYLRALAEDMDYESHFKEAVRGAQPVHLREHLYTAMLDVWTTLFQNLDDREVGRSWWH